MKRSKMSIDTLSLIALAAFVAGKRNLLDEGGYMVATTYRPLKRWGSKIAIDILGEDIFVMTADTINDELKYVPRDREEDVIHYFLDVDGIQNVKQISAIYEDNIPVF